jgi:hypothetical protein
VLRAALGHARAAVGDEAVEQLQVGAQGADLVEDGDRRVARDHDVGAHPGGGGVRGGRAPRVPGGGERHLADPELERARHRHAQPARLERSRGILPFILDPHPLHPQVRGEAGRLDQRRPPLAQAHGVRRVAHGKELGVAPQVGRAASQILAPKPATDRLQVVARVERLFAAGRKAVRDFTGIRGAAAGALQVRGAAGGDGFGHFRAVIFGVSRVRQGFTAGPGARP